MSDRFDDLLFGAVDSAAQAAHAPGAAAARKRGKRRRNHQRLAASALSLALLGGVSGIASASLDGSNRVPTANATAAAPISSTASPSTGASLSPAGTSSSGTIPASTPPSSQASVPSPAKYVPGAWISSAQMPFARTGYTTWVWQQAVGTSLGNDVYELTVAQYKQVAVCNSSRGGSALGDGLATGLAGAQFRTYSASDSGKIWPDGTIPAYASQFALFYLDAAAASAAMNALSADFTACAAEASGANPATGTTIVGSDGRTLQGDAAQCWSMLAVQPGSSTNGTIDHTCFVRSGSMIATATVSINQVGTINSVAFGSSDNTMVPELQQDLADYTGGSSGTATGTPGSGS
jgi:hypothetical protein